MKCNAPELWLDDYKANEQNIGRLLIYAAIAAPGAAVIASMMARRIGAGHTIIACARGYQEFFASLQMGAQIEEYLDSATFAQMIDDFAVRAVLIGAGSGVNIAVRERVIGALKRQVAVILDSQGVLSFGNSLDLLKIHEQQTPLIIAIRPNELYALSGADAQADMRELLCQLAVRINGIVICKSNPLVIASANAKEGGIGVGEIIYNPSDFAYSDISSNNDVLCGMVAGLCALGMPALSASMMGAYCHGLGQKKLGKGLICEDFNHIIPAIMKEY